MTVRSSKRLIREHGVEGAAPAGDALRRDAAPHRLDETLRDREAEPAAGDVATRAESLELDEEAPHLVRGNSRSIVPDRQAYRSVPLRGGFDHDRVAGVAVLDRVRE